jgi:UDP-N-acetylglucosamine 4-epimerase
MNELAMMTDNLDAINTVYNTAYGDRTTLNDMFHYLKLFLSDYDKKIADIQVIHGPNRAGDIPHSLASIEKAKKLLHYNPNYSFQEGLKEAIKWYWDNLK